MDQPTDGGGSVLLEYNGNSTMTGFTNLPVGSYAIVKASPRSDYKVESITGPDGTALCDGNCGGGTGLPVEQFFNIVEGNVTATFSIVPNARIMLSVPLNATAGTEVSANANGTTSNVDMSTLNYEFQVDGTVKQASNLNACIFDAPQVAGAHTVTLAVYDADDNLLGTKSATLNVVSVADTETKLCVSCHTGSTPSIVADYNASVHYGKNACTNCHTDTPHEAGVTPDSGCTANCHQTVDLSGGHMKYHGCAVCHNGGPLGDEDPKNPDDVPKYTHKIIVDASACTTCHGEETPELYTAYASSPHAESAHGDGICQRCHGNGGAVLGDRLGFTGGQDVMGDHAASPRTEDPYGIFGADLAEVTPGESVTCATCHDPHTDTNFHAINTYVNGAVVGWDPNQNGVNNDQFDLCTSCHVLFDNTGAEVQTWHKDRLGRTFVSHYDDPSTGYGLDNNLIEGYNIRKTSEAPCADCHNVHSADLTIQHQWAESGHAGKIAVEKEKGFEAAAQAWLEAEITAGKFDAGTTLETVVGTSHGSDVTPLDEFGESVEGVQAARQAGSTTSYAWAHYPWNNTETRGDCQECHTATGYMNRVDTPDTYTSAMNDFSYLKNWSATTGSPQAELLYCWGCHTSATTGELRAGSAFTLDYTYNTNEIVIEAGASNSCVNCHAGRGNNDTIEATAAADRSSRFQGHHGTAAGTLFSAKTHIGYEYSGQVYDSRLKKDGTVNHFEHDIIGLENGETEGPCVACHMGAEKNHTWEILELDETGAPVAINTQATCDGCHSGGYAMTVTKLEEEKEGYQQAIQLLGDLLAQTKGLSNKLDTDITAAYKTVDLDYYGAFQNFKYTSDSPGGFAHNRNYVKRLLFDSIDFVEDGVLDDSIADYSAKYPLAAAWLGTSRK